MSPKPHRGPGQNGVTAELIRAALPWLIRWMILVWQWPVAILHVAQSWKDGIITILSKIGESPFQQYLATALSIF